MRDEAGRVGTHYAGTPVYAPELARMKSAAQARIQSACLECSALLSSKRACKESRCDEDSRESRRDASECGTWGEAACARTIWSMLRRATAHS